MSEGTENSNDPDEMDTLGGSKVVDIQSSGSGNADDSNASSNIDLIMDIPITLTLELGKARLSLKEIMALEQDSIVELERLTSEPLNILVNGQLIAQGEAVTVGDRYGIRVVQLVNNKNGIKQAA